MSKAMRAYSYLPAYNLQLLQVEGCSICLVVTKHLFLMSSILSSMVSSKAKRLGGHITLCPSTPLQPLQLRQHNTIFPLKALEILPLC